MIAKIKEFLASTKATSEAARIRHEWDRQRARALSPSELSEIDAIFSRSL